MASTAPGRTVFTHGCADDGHEAMSHAVLAERFAGVLGFAFGGPCETAEIDATCYLIPHTSLSGAATAHRYRITGEHDLHPARRY